MRCNIVDTTSIRSILLMTPERFRCHGNGDSPIPETSQDRLPLARPEF